MTTKTIDLPPEPPIGTEWLDRGGHQWRHEPEGWVVQGGRIRNTWSAVCRYLPLTLVEPDPWPTAPLIVASIGERREVLARNERGGYESPVTGAWKGGPTLTNVVPVTVVPTERVDYLSAAHASWVAGAIDDRTMIGYAIGLLESLDELGLDQ